MNSNLNQEMQNEGGTVKLDTTSKHQLCPCGSGKRYRDCCMKALSLDDFRAAVISRESDQFLDRVYLKFATEWFNRIPVILLSLLGGAIDKIPGITERLRNLYDEEFEGADSEVLELLNEHVLYDYVLPEGMTIFERYLEREQRKIRPVVYHVLASWVNSHISVYEVVEINPFGDEGTFVDIFTGEQFPLDLQMLNSLMDLREGDLIVSRLLSKGEKYDVAAFLPIYGFLKSKLLTELTAAKEAKLPHGEWPEFLKKYGHEVIIASAMIIDSIVDDYMEELVDLEEKLEWPNSRQLDVARLIRTNLRENYSPEEIYTAISIWHEYCERVNPKINKPETMVAVMEYVTNLGSGGTVTQKEIATKYGISPNTISQRYGEIVDMIAATSEAADPEYGYVPTLERNVFQMTNFMQEIGIEDLDELEDLVRKYPSKIVEFNARNTSPRFRAQELLYEAWESTGEAKVELALKALEVDPDSADAYVILAQETAATIEDALALYIEGVKAGEQALGEEFFKAHTGYFWGLVETRPYMRARYGVAATNELLNHFDEAIGHYQAMLELNPADNQGIRFRLLRLLLKKDRMEEAAVIFAQYPGEKNADFLYGKFVFQYKLNNSDYAREALLEAIKFNPYVPEFLLGVKPLPEFLPDGVVLGDENEAAFYAMYALDLWHETPGMLKFLLDSLKSLHKYGGKGQR